MSVLIARRGRLLRLEATFGQEPEPRYALEIDPKAGEAAEKHRQSWVGQDPTSEPRDEE
ncbi:MAG TPA: hypothetical protein VFT74_09885 [Isosphaeraceae bacterium]|nr:hypothetical protein [Isosphaeraceae bacterium]